MDPRSRTRGGPIALKRKKQGDAERAEDAEGRRNCKRLFKRWLSREHSLDGITLRDLRDLRRLLDATPMPESVEVPDRPRFQKQTLIAQITQIAQIDSLVVPFASSRGQP
jgi:hypothetical protein